MIPEQHTAYHTLTIFHTGDKLKFGRQIAWKLVALWKHSSSFGGIYGQVLVALYGQVLVASTDKFWWHYTDKIGGHSVCAVWWCQSTTDTRTTPRSTSGGHFMQVWWSCHANLVVIWFSKSEVSWMGGFETEAEVCKSSVVFRLQQEAGL